MRRPGPTPSNLEEDAPCRTPNRLRPTRPHIGRTIADSTPHWPSAPKRPPGAPNILLVLFDDVGFSDFGCYGSGIRTPHIDALAAQGLRYTGFHTTAMCSTTRAALLTGRNHHAVGHGLPGQLRQRLSRLPRQDQPAGRHAGRDAAPARLAQLHGRQVACDTARRRPARRARSTAGRWAAASTATTASWTPRPTSTRPSWCATTRMWIAPGTFASGYHLSADLVDESIRMLADHQADAPDAPWLLWLAFGACHAPHQAPQELIRAYDDGSRTAGTWSASSGWRARRRSASCRRIPNCRRATTACRPGARCGRRSAASSRGCSRPTRRCSNMPTQQIGRLMQFLRGQRHGRRHAGAGAVRQRRQPGGRPAGLCERDGAVQPQARGHGREAAPHRRHRRARHAFELSARLGHGGQHAAQALQAKHPRRRHPRPAGAGLAQGHRRARRAAPPVLPRQRPAARRCSTCAA